MKTRIKTIGDETFYCFNLEKIAETRQAILVRQGTSTDVWLPKRQINFDLLPYSRVDVEVPEWLMDRCDLVIEKD